MIKRQSKHQALIIVSGSEGRIEKAQNIAQLLSSRGYICLAIAYFGLEGLPKHLKRIPLECLVEAKSYLRRTLKWIVKELESMDGLKEQS